MTTSDSSIAGALRREILNFYWGVWSELGVSGWVRTHERWAIDPEPLIVFSPAVFAAEPRLRDEAIDWCIRNWRHVSVVRLRHLLHDNEDEQTDAWGEFSATVNRFSGGTKWPHATVERTYSTTGRSVLRPLAERSMIYLRMRSIFGLSARTEVLRTLLVTGERSTAAMLATQTNYAKRNVADACEALVQAGVLQSKQLGNRLYFSLADPPALASFVGPSPDVFPEWPVLLRVVNGLFRWTQSEEGSDGRVLTVKTHRLYDELLVDLTSLGLALPDRDNGAQLLPAWRAWALSLSKAVASGQWLTERHHSALRDRSSSKHIALP